MGTVCRFISSNKKYTIDKCNLFNEKRENIDIYLGGNIRCGG